MFEATTVQNLQGHAAQLLLTTCTLLCILLVTLAIVLPVQEKNKSWICAGRSSFILREDEG